ncbi:MAG: cyclase family protein [Hormoscilla sp. SP5CHS1]|nr:cyclase family protein [Hormoscilla sp. SP5CHS1]
MNNNPNQAQVPSADEHQKAKGRFPLGIALTFTLLGALSSLAIFSPLLLKGREVETASISDRSIVDLTHTMHDDMPFWPGGVPFTKTKLVDYDQGYLLHKFEMGENTGTHIDAPAHFIKGNRSIDRIPISELIVPAVTIDIQDKVVNNPDYQLSAADVIRWEAKHGQILAGSLVILNTGWHKRFGNPQAYINMDSNKVMHFPGFGADSAKLLVERDVVGIGIDTLSLDYGGSSDFATHGIMLKENKYQIENMANLDALPPTGATVIIGVLPVKDGSQAQARIFAIIP